MYFWQAEEIAEKFKAAVLKRDPNASGKTSKTFGNQLTCADGRVRDSIQNLGPFFFYVFFYFCSGISFAKRPQKTTLMFVFGSQYIMGRDSSLSPLAFLLHAALQVPPSLFHYLFCHHVTGLETRDGARADMSTTLVVNTAKGAKHVTINVRTNKMVDTLLDSFRFWGRTVHGLRIAEGPREGEVRVEARTPVIRDCWEQRQLEDDVEGESADGRFRFTFIKQTQKRRRLCHADLDVRSWRSVPLSLNR